ncbi:MAG TPA: LuxR C-terminal-related transcriptional regulator, partial [Candidatus Limnocylindria bacterium]
MLVVTGPRTRVCPGVAALGWDGRRTRPGHARRPLATVSARVARRSLGGVDRTVRRSPASHPRPLTARECATLECLARGMTQKEIAFELGISINTV